MSFTITQQPDNANLYLYPDGNSSVSLSVSGATYNYQAVDEVWHTPNDDTDYVYTTSTVAVGDIYTVENPSNPTGNINYVRVIANAKSYLIQQNKNGIYKLYIYDGATNEYSNNKAPVTTSYKKYYATWNNKPSGGSWTWTDINNLKIGVQCSSPTVTSTDYLDTIRPIGDSGGNNVNMFGDDAYYKCVDDVNYDEDNTYIQQYQTATLWDDAYRDFSMSNINPYYNSVISNVKVFHRAKDVKNDSYRQTRADVFVSGSRTNGTSRTNTSTYTTWSDTFNTAPNSGVTWTTSDVNNLIIRMGFRASDYWNSVRTTQLYATVSYDIVDSPEIRTTQVYAVVNYTPPQSTVTLNTPETLNLTHTRKIQRHTFPSGEYEVDDYGRSNKTLTIAGTETTDAYSKMQTLKDMTHYSAPVTISELPDSNLDTNYHIKNFTYRQEPGQPNIYHWNIVLEED